MFIIFILTLNSFTVFAQELEQTSGQTEEQQDVKTEEQTAEQTGEELPESLEYAGWLSYVMESIMQDYKGGEITYDQLYEGAVRGMADTLDPYSNYMNWEEYDEFVNSINQAEMAFGIVFYEDDYGNTRIYEVISESSAADKGLMPEDIVTVVNGQSTEGMSVYDVIYQLNMSGDTASLVLKRGDADINATIEKRFLTFDTVTVEKMSDAFNFVDETQATDIRLVSITSVGDTTAEQLKEAITQMQAEGVKRIIIDLRDNSGGYVAGAMDVCRLLVAKGVIMTSEDKHGVKTVYESALEKAPFDDMVVLTNQYTASMAEAIAACLQDNGYNIIGQKSYGKGVMQGEMYAGSGVLTLTTEEFYGPKGHKINGYGIMPNIIVAQPEFIDIDNPGDNNDILLIKNILKYCGFEVGEENTAVYDNKTKASVRELKAALGLSRDDVIDEEFKVELNTFYYDVLFSTDLTLQTALEYYTGEWES
jgi:carboxyl-terminal processing protease